jgi:hypothetical protein
MYEDAYKTDNIVVNPYARVLSTGVPDPVRQRQQSYIDHVSHARPGIKVFPDRLHVITIISNPIRYRARYELYRAFEKHMEESGAILYTVEMAFGDRHFEITQPGNPHHIQLRSRTELWHKENMINIGISRLPLDVKYIAWIDADIIFTRPDWCQETLHQLQHYKIIQLFSHAQDVGPRYEPLPGGQFDGFVYSYNNNIPLPYTDKFMYYPYKAGGIAKGGDMMKWHSGYAWAARREAIDELGGLVDWAILGSSDHNMAAALVGKVKYTVHGDVHPVFMNMMLEWERKAQKYIRRNLGYVDGLILHNWHGKKKDRGYVSRWKILVDNQFNPQLDIKKDWQGLFQLEDHGDMRSIKLRDDIRKYFRERSEDSIDL